MRIRLLALLVAALLVAPLTGALAPTRAAGPAGPGIARLSAGRPGGEVVRGIATFDSVPTAGDVAALRALGLTVQPMRRLPLALVRGPVAALRAAAAGPADDVYPDEAIELHDVESADSMGAAGPRQAGLDGAGVTVAVVDSGCDASHPDLAERVVHNVKLYSAEYVNLPPDSSNTIVVPIEAGPYQNTDLGSGHGTHVAGIIAASGVTAPEHLGVAPAASLVCYSIGEILFTTAVVTAYDHLLDQPALWGVRVINNSWGNAYQQYDPRHPVNVATRATARLDVLSVFSAGNSGNTNVEMSVSPFSHAPWVLSVAAGTIDHQRGSFSSNGLRFDNSAPVTVGAGGHTVFDGDRIGVYHPDVTAPGVDISSTCDTTGTVIGPCPPPAYGNERASGTSMAAPHVAGAAAVLLHANPALTPAQVRAALQSTATPVTGLDAGGNPVELDLWQVGYGFVDLAAAVDAVKVSNHGKHLAALQRAADARVLAARGYAVPRSDFFTYDAPRVAVGGSDHRTFTVDVPAGTDAVKVTISHPSLAVVGTNRMIYEVTVRDAGGAVLGTTTESPSGAGTASLLVDLGSVDPPVQYGPFTFEVSGELAVSDPDTFDSESLLGRMVVLQVAQLTARS